MITIAGIHPIEILLTQDPERIQRLFYIPRQSPSPRIQKLLNEAHRQKIPVTPASPSDVPQGELSHQGIWARITPLSPPSLKAWLSLQRGRKICTLLILDSITDPHNMGAIIRTAACLGCQGVLLPKNRRSPLTPVVWKASAGAVGILPILQEVNLVRSVERLKQNGFWIFGTRAHEAIPAWKAPWSNRSAIVLGSEGKGMRPLLESKCDFHLSIPMTGPITSLNVSVAAGMILYERNRWLALRLAKGDRQDA